MREDIKKADIIVIKVGTSLLVSPETGIIESAISKISQCLGPINEIREENYFSIVRAVGAGTVQLGEVSKHAAAAVGQGILTGLYEAEFKKHDQKIGQLLLSRDILTVPEKSSGF